MQPGPGGKVDLKIAALQRLVSSDLDEARLFLLVNLLETYLVLDEQEDAAYRQQVRAEGNEDMEAVELTWADRMRLEGREQGIEQGEQRGKREAIVLLVRERFGIPAPEFTARLENVSNGALDQLLIRVLRANSLDEVTTGLGGSAGS